MSFEIYQGLCFKVIIQGDVKKQMFIQITKNMRYTCTVLKKSILTG